MLRRSTPRYEPKPPEPKRVLMPTQARLLEPPGPAPDMWGVQENRKSEASTAAAGGSGGAKLSLVQIQAQVCSPCSLCGPRTATPAAPAPPRPLPLHRHARCPCTAAPAATEPSSPTSHRSPGYPPSPDRRREVPRRNRLWHRSRRRDTTSTWLRRRCLLAVVTSMPLSQRSERWVRLGSAATGRGAMVLRVRAAEAEAEAEAEAARQGTTGHCRRGPRQVP